MATAKKKASQRAAADVGQASKRAARADVVAKRKSESGRAKGGTGRRKVTAKRAARPVPARPRGEVVDPRFDALSISSRQAVQATLERVENSIARHVDSDVDVEYLEIVQAATESAADMLFSALKVENVARKQLDAHRVEPVQRAAKSVFGQLMLDAYSTEISNVQLADRAQLAIDAFTVVLTGNRRQLASVIDALEVDDEGDSDDFDVEQARARARIRAQAIFRKVLDESLTVGDLKPYKSRQRLQQLRDEGRLFAIKTPYERGLVYPAWQFDDNFDPLPVMADLIATAKAVDLSPLAFHQVMTGRRGSGKRGVELIASGREDLALSLLKATDRHASREQH